MEKDIRKLWWVEIVSSIYFECNFKKV